MDMNAPETGCGEDVAAYALGALPPEDARSFRRHLEDCSLCQTDLASLKPAVDMLPISVESVAPPPELRRRIMAVVEAEAAERRRADEPARASWFERLSLRRPLPALVAASVLVLAGVGVGVQATQDPPGQVIPCGSCQGGSEARLEVKDGRGTLIVAKMKAPPRGRVFQVWTRRGKEQPKPTDALFTPARDGHASVVVPGNMENVDEVLVTHEPDGGSKRPTVRPSIVIQT
jgi:anti-sigma-K factor RskA